MNKKHILLIENSDTELDFFADALEETHISFLCSTAKSSTQALKILKNAIPDFIFADMHIITKAGLEFLQTLKSFHNIPVIVYSNIQCEKKVFQDHVNDSSFFCLPGNVTTMAVILRRFLQ